LDNTVATNDLTAEGVCKKLHRRKKMLSSGGKKGLEKKHKNKTANVSSFEKERRVSDRLKERTCPSHASPSVRKDRVKEAKAKKQNGDYDSEEVHRKIADRLMELFGID
jgi:anti-sigma28 factor (negative regulator of flagellin synthesis)